MKLEIGSIWVYGSKGVCKVEGIHRERFGSEERDYYCLTPLGDGKSQIFVPVDSERIEKTLRQVVTPVEIDRILAGLPRESAPWIEDSRARANHFRTVLESADIPGMMVAIRSLWQRKDRLSAVGKRLNSADQTACAKMEKLLHDEFSLALGIPCEEVPPFIRQRVATVSAG